MNVFVTGASGYLGASIVRALVKRGHKVRGLARSAETAQRLAKAGVEAIAGSLAELEVLRAAASTADGVIHAAFNHDDWSAIQAAFLSEKHAVKAILQAIAGTHRPFLYTSGAGTIGDTGKFSVDEDVLPRPGPMVETRFAVENMTRAAAAEGVRSTVIRPGLVYGRAGSAIMQVLIADARRAGVGRTVGDGSNAWSVVHIDDLGELYALALERSPPGAVLHGAAGAPVPMIEVARSMSRALGVGDRTEAVALDEARRSIPLADVIASEKRLSSVLTRKLTGWNPHAPSLAAEIESGSYQTLLQEPVSR